ncbi:kinase-like protein [Fomitiporia mediterranea MF3/22]|uniref:kinase-like protein n=1 Tax=Fomitiporia mediterranea (strain MF3/22) TaxID=694068 RepID=UPI000440984F|nr:kinase-like protein [Fomitiporia mediterranea MF3/22]EJD04661.1 kinase-like protein [Fomitiporia mediterranea MF3/22]
MPGDTLTNLERLELYEGDTPEPGWTDKIQHFILKRFLGSGAHSGTMEIERPDIKNKDGQPTHFAVKIIPRPRRSEDYTGTANKKLVEAVRHEAGIMRELSHPHILKCYGAFENEFNLVIILDVAEGDDLSYRLSEQQCFLGKETKHYIRFQKQSGAPQAGLERKEILVVGDFGLAIKLDKASETEEKLEGTKGYIAPERFNRVLTTKADMWSVGNITYKFLLGTDIYRHIVDLYSITYNEKKDRAGKAIGRTLTNERVESVLEKYCSGYVSDLGIDFLRRCLEVNPDQRMSAEQALHHQWLEQAIPDGKTHTTQSTNVNTVSNEPDLPSKNKSEDGKDKVWFGKFITKHRESFRSRKSRTSSEKSEHESESRLLVGLDT